MIVEHWMPDRLAGPRCRREDSNLHGVLNPTRSLAWRPCRFGSERKHLGATPVILVHLSATAPEWPFRSRVPSGCPARKASESGLPVFE